MLILKICPRVVIAMPDVLHAVVDSNAASTSAMAAKVRIELRLIFMSSETLIECKCWSDLS